MFDKIEDVAYCNQRAEEFRRMAAREIDPKLKQAYIDMQDRWLSLAACYEFPQSTNALRAALAADHADKISSS
jgi:hypothetical protein